MRFLFFFDETSWSFHFFDDQLDDEDEEMNE